MRQGTFARMSEQPRREASRVAAQLELHQARCERCKKDKTLSRFFESTPYSDDQIAPRVCLECAQDPIVPSEEVDDFPTLTPAHRIALQELFKQGGNVSAAGRASGLSTTHIQDMLKGRYVKDFKSAFQTLLTMEGLDLGTIAKRLAHHGLKAKRNQWNPKNQEWDEFDDNNVQLNAIKHATRLMEMEPSYGAPSSGPAVEVNLITNLGSSEAAAEPPGTFVVTAEKVGEGEGS